MSCVTGKKILSMVNRLVLVLPLLFSLFVSMAFCSTDPGNALSHVSNNESPSYFPFSTVVKYQKVLEELKLHFYKKYTEDCSVQSGSSETSDGSFDEPEAPVYHDEAFESPCEYLSPVPKNCREA